MEDKLLQELLMALYVYFVSPILTIIMFALFIYVVLSWVLMMGMVDRQNPLPYQIYNFLGSVFEPLLRPLRRVIPPISGLDLSVLFLILIIYFLQDYALLRLIKLVPF